MSTDVFIKKKNDTRLPQLAKQWSEEVNPGFFDKFTPADLRLMLQSFQPLQQLIQQIAQGEAICSVSSTTTALVDTPSTNETVLNEQVQQLQQQAAKDEAELKSAVSTIHDQSEQIQELKQQLSLLKVEQQEQQTQFSKELKTASVEFQQAQANLKQEQKEKSDLADSLSKVQKQLSDSQVPAELQFLRAEPELAQALGLSLPDNDQQALIATVAVLAQKDNLERLWDNLKDRCESERRPASSDECQLLATALDWYNQNWKTRPFQLLLVSSPSSYDFEKQQKTKHHTDGETVSQVWLPGIADGAGKPLRKTLVLTH